MKFKYKVADDSSWKEMTALDIDDLSFNVAVSLYSIKQKFPIELTVQHPSRGLYRVKIQEKKRVRFLIDKERVL